MTDEAVTLSQAIQNFQTALKSGDKQGALRWAEIALKLAPHREEPWLLMAAVADPLASVRYLNKALEINPKSARARAGLAWALKQAELINKIIVEPPVANPLPGNQNRIETPTSQTTQVDSPPALASVPASVPAADPLPDNQNRIETRTSQTTQVDSPPAIAPVPASVLASDPLSGNQKRIETPNSQTEKVGPPPALAPAPASVPPVQSAQAPVIAPKPSVAQQVPAAPTISQTAPRRVSKPVPAPTPVRAPARETKIPNEPTSAPTSFLPYPKKQNNLVLYILAPLVCIALIALGIWGVPFTLKLLSGSLSHIPGTPTPVGGQIAPSADSSMFPTDSPAPAESTPTPVPVTPTDGPLKLPSLTPDGSTATPSAAMSATENGGSAVFYYFVNTNCLE